ncbi:hypothetical protein Tsubulata_016997 [Turnera subulata]|uniref:Uncharacterized protein n=1 Tax=Turnera subulata TaxID=218843 RepID=A0A9Q0G9C3_9ROSI|nr:hypothetical protein Tsubulata_016997 [Turnera subulata]
MAIPITARSLAFKVVRHEPELIPPAQPTPGELKPLSDIDDQEGLRAEMDFVQFYGSSPSMKYKDPAKIMREAIAKALVFYYPFAGRLREGPNRKLMVECTGEGVVFVEAEAADVTLEQFGDALSPPFPCFNQLLIDVPRTGTAQLLNRPLLFIQVTRLRCGGFVLATRMNHAMCDAAGLVQFMSSVAEMAGGGSHLLSIPPVWKREVLTANYPLQITHKHPEYDQVLTDSNLSANDDVDNHIHMAHKSFFFGPKEISTLKNLVHGPITYSTYEMLTACLWKCRTIALQIASTEEVSLLGIVNARGKFKEPPLPSGFYGNGIVFPAAVTTAGKLSQSPLGYAAGLLKKAKEEMSQEYVLSVCALMVSKGRPMFTTARSFAVSDLRHVGVHEVDFGWGKPIYGGPASAGLGDFSGVSTFTPYTYKKNGGENGIVVPVLLPSDAMERFAEELRKMFREAPAASENVAPKITPSSL